MNVTLPYQWSPRPYQQKSWAYLSGGGLRCVKNWHRRSGKDEQDLQHMNCAAHERVGNYWYMMPEYAQCRKAMWDAVNPHTGLLRLDEAFPRFLRKPEGQGGTNNQEMKLSLRSGSTFQLLGADNFHSLVGSPPVGLVFSEYSRTNPSAWAYLMPIVEENGGWVCFNSTPFGDNHFRRLSDFAASEPGWYYEKLTVDQTHVYTPATLEKIRRELYAIHGADYGEALFQQEYYCLSPTTRVLRSDLTWVTMAEITEGDELIGVDEQVTDERQRKLRPSRVTKRWETTKRCVRLTLSDGRVITASEEHPWLMKQRPSKARKEQTYKWVTTEALRVGQALADTGLHPWKTEDSRDGGWLAGLYDGEGCLSRSTVQVAQKPGRVLTMAARILTDLGHAFFVTRGGECVTYSASFLSALRILGSLRPIRLLEKAQSIWNGAVATRGIVKIVSIDDAGMQPVIGISTSTKTFIAEGLITHNCSFDAAIPGSIWGDCLDLAQREGRIAPFAVDVSLPVYTGWDLGRTDDTAIWFYQLRGRELLILDHHSSHGKDVEFYVDLLKEKRELHGIRYGRHWLPHDARPRVLAAGAGSILQQFTEAARRHPALGTFAIAKRLDIQEGIQAARATFPLCRFHDTRTETGRRSLKHYHREWDEEKQKFVDQAVHDWSSHDADAFRTLAVSWKFAAAVQPPADPMTAILKSNVTTQTLGDLRKAHFRRLNRERAWTLMS